MSKSDSPQTFKEKLIDYYISSYVGHDTQRFLAFVYVLRCIKYRFPPLFCTTLRRLGLKEVMRQNYGILIGLQELDMSPNFFSRHRCFVDIIFFTFLDLEIKIDDRLKDKAVASIPQPYRNRFLKLCEIYSKVVADDHLNHMLDKSYVDRNRWFLNEIDGRKHEAKRGKIKRKPNKIKKKKSRNNFGGPSVLMEESEPWYDFTINSAKLIYTPMGVLNKRY